MKVLWELQTERIPLGGGSGGQGAQRSRQENHSRAENIREKFAKPVTSFHG